MRVLVFDYYDYYDFEKEFVNDEDTFFYKSINKKYDVLIINFNFYPEFVEVKKHFKESVVIFVCEKCDEFIYKKVLNVADYCYTYNELFKLKIRMEYLKKRVIKLNSKIFKYKDLVFNLNTNQLYKNSQPLRLTKSEGEILSLLIKNKDKFMSKEEIERRSESIDSIASIKVIVSKLRKIGFDIENIKNLGYKLKE